MNDERNIFISKKAKISKTVKIHPFVIIGDGIEIEGGVEILPFTYLGKIPGWRTLKRQQAFNKKIIIKKGSRIGPHVTIYYDVEIGEYNLICEGVSIREGCRLGKNCIIARNVTLNYNAKIGDNTRILDSTHITGNSFIGKNVFISTLVSTTNDKSFGVLPYDKKMKGPYIEDGAKIGSGASLLPNIKIGKNVIVAAGSVVNKDVPAGKIVKGNPAQIIGDSRAFMNIAKFIL